MSSFFLCIGDHQRAFDIAQLSVPHGLLQSDAATMCQLLASIHCERGQHDPAFLGAIAMSDPTYVVRSPFWMLIDHWQALIAGIFALVAAMGTIWVTLASAGREIEAANKQTQATRQQIAASSRQERRRTVHESYAFFSMMRAAMIITVLDVGGARVAFASACGQRPELPEAKRKRRKIGRSGYAELREACMRIGGTMSLPFLELDNLVAKYGDEVDQSFGLNEFIEEALGSIQNKALDLQERAEKDIERCLPELESTQDEASP